MDCDGLWWIGMDWDGLDLRVRWIIEHRPYDVLLFVGCWIFHHLALSRLREELVRGDEQISLSYWVEILTLHIVIVIVVIIIMIFIIVILCHNDPFINLPDWCVRNPIIIIPESLHRSSKWGTLPRGWIWSRSSAGSHRPGDQCDQHVDQDDSDDDSDADYYYRYADADADHSDCNDEDKCTWFNFAPSCSQIKYLIYCTQKIKRYTGQKMYLVQLCPFVQSFQLCRGERGVDWYNLSSSLLS